MMRLASEVLGSSGFARYEVANYAPRVREQAQHGVLVGASLSGDRNLGCHDDAELRTSHARSGRTRDR